ncbi:hypothetical protein LTR66_010074 [Elasticomyces elasticus]|nr:hypothetical protein LTR66_010074 [Elasticomyces elasticus]
MDSPHLLTPALGISIGVLQYVFDFTDLPPETYASQPTSLRQQRGWITPEMPASLTPTPSARSHAYQGFLIDSAVAKGTYGSVGFGWRLSGNKRELIAAKHIICPYRQYPMVNNELVMLCRFQGHPNVVHVASDYDYHQAMSEQKAGQIVDIYIIMEPATSTKLGAISHNDVKQSQIFFRDALSGLSHMHKAGVIHRDLSPNNIGINKIEPKAVLLDLGCAIKAETDMDCRVGTIAFLAPEIMALKRSESAQPFNAKADV